MYSKTNLRTVVFLVAIAAVVSIGYKLNSILKHYDDFNPQKVYKVNYSFFFKSEEGHTFVKTFVPQSNARQRISQESLINNSKLNFDTELEGVDNTKAIWSTYREGNYHTPQYTFLFEGKAQYFDMPKTFKNAKADSEYLNPSENIQSDASEIETLANQLKEGTSNDREIIRKLYDYVFNIPSAPIISLTDALTTIQQNRASCNGKSRLLVALARNLGYPARIKGGIILENTTKRTSHVWVEILANDIWIPFDALNNHFAYLPANYLEIYQGDEFLITHTPELQFDYTYEMEEVNHIPFVQMNSTALSKLSKFTLLKIIDAQVIPKNAMTLLLLLPLGGLIVAFLRNVVGLKTLGVFLPVLIAFSLLHTGFVTGILLFLGLIIIVGIISYPLDKIGLLYTPKLVASLTIMVGLIIVLTSLGIHYDIHWLTTLTFFPTIILTVASERFSSATIEDGYKPAIDKLLQTLIATTVCFFAFSWQPLHYIFIIFPELIALITVISVVLGRYIGIRWVEFHRFKPLLAA